MDHFLKDVRYALRTLAKHAGFTVAAMLTLALGVGATTALFSVVHHVLLRTLPYDAPDRIVQVWNPWSNEPGVTRGRSPMASLDYSDIRSAISSFEGVAAYTPQASANLTGGELPERVQLTRSTAELFGVLGGQALIGRTFTAAEDAPGGSDVVVLSHGLWQRRFGGAASVLGSVIRLDGVAHRIVGVMPASFRLPADYQSVQPTEVWKPLALDADNLDRGNQWLHVVARLKPGVEIAAANAELAALTNSWIEQGFRIDDLPPYYAVPIEAEVLGDIRPTLLILFGAVVFVLLIACANVANLMLARAEGRRAELALRTALGAARSRLVAQLFTESLALALLGGALGLVLAYVGVEALVALEPTNIPRVDEVRIDLGTLAFTAVLVIATAIFFGLVPAISASRVTFGGELRAIGRTVTGGRQRARFRGMLVASEVALSVVLVIGAVLMIRTVAQMSRIDLGFEPDNVLTFGVSLPTAEYAPEARVMLHTQLVEQLALLPGVHAAGAARMLPLTDRLAGGSIEVEGREPPRPGQGLPNTRWQVVTPGFFESMRYTRVAGRFLEHDDRADRLPVVVVNETAAQMLWPGQPAVGRRLRTTNADVPWFAVVGVVRDVRHNGVIAEPSPTVYFALEQVSLTKTFTPATMSFALRTAMTPQSLATSIRAAVRSLDPNLPVTSLRTMDDAVADALAQPRFTTLLLSIFAVIALALAVIGIYGVVSYHVSQLQKEIGIRTALGASQAAVLSLLAWKGGRFAALGLGAGIVAALFLARLMTNLLYSVRPLDPWTFLLVPMLFALVALTATCVPALRALAVDPMHVLRQD